MIDLEHPVMLYNSKQFAIEDIFYKTCADNYNGNFIWVICKVISLFHLAALAAVNIGNKQTF